MKEPIIYRQATPSDVPFLTKILIDASEASGVLIPAEKIQDYPETYQYVSDFPQEQEVGVIAENEEGQPVGAVWIKMLSNDEHAVKYPMPELTIGVLESYRRKGIGERLMSELYRYASKINIREISLGVHKDNLPAINLYLKQGWVQDGFFKEYIMMSRKTSRYLQYLL